MSAVEPQPFSTPDTAERIEREKIRLAFGTWVQYVDGVPFAVALAMMMSGAWPAIGSTAPHVAATWVACVVFWSVATSVSFQYYRANEAKHTLAHWRNVLTAQVFAHAIVWGSFAWTFWEPGNSANQAIVCTVTLALMVACFFALSSYYRLLVVELVLLALTACAAFLHYGGPLAHLFTALLPLFTALLINYGRTFAQNTDANLHMRFENETLIDAVNRANKAKSEFLASMSHDLRTPLNAIIGYADMMKAGTLGPVEPARYREYIDDIASSGAHLLRMINDILDLAKIEAGKRELNIVALRLSEVAKDAMRLVGPQAAQVHVELMFDPKHDAVVRADERAVKQMLVNLLSNAVKFSRAGGIAIVFCEILADNRVVFGVKDTGTGMTVEMQKKALEPFTQASDKMTVEGHGTGLGLPIIKGLIEAHQGMLKIESTPNVGSRIWVEFPPERLIRRIAVAAAAVA
jgi:signal transduction histidine kinase